MSLRKPVIYITPTESFDIQKTLSATATEVKNPKNWFNKLNEPLDPIYIEALVETFGFIPIYGWVFKSALKTARAKQKLLVEDEKKVSSSLAISEAQATKEDMELTNITDELEKINLSEWNSFVEQISFSSITNELEFPPGHPLPGKFYRLHPLKSKNNKYIPVEVFDSLLYAERENELIRILVDLGATKISIQEVFSKSTEGTLKAKAEIIGAGGVGADTQGKSGESKLDSRVTLLQGKNWTSDMSFDKTKYSWLPYEPAWEALVYARTEGGCLSASVELTSDTSYSISGQLGLTEGLLQNIGSLEAGANLARFRQQRRLFVVEFASS